MLELSPGTEGLVGTNYYYSFLTLLSSLPANDGHNFWHSLLILLTLFALPGHFPEVFPQPTYSPFPKLLHGSLHLAIKWQYQSTPVPLQSSSHSEEREPLTILPVRVKAKCHSQAHWRPSLHAQQYGSSSHNWTMMTARLGSSLTHQHTHNSTGQFS